MNEITIQFLNYFSTIFFGSLILQIISKKVVSKTTNINLLEKQLEAYKDLYYNTVHDNLYNEISHDEASKYIEGFYEKVNKDLDYSMLFSSKVLKKVSKNNKYKKFNMKSLNSSITKDFNRIKRLLGYPCNPTFYQKMLLLITKTLRSIILSTLFFFIYLEINKIIPNELNDLYSSLISTGISFLSVIVFYIYVTKDTEE